VKIRYLEDELWILAWNASVQHSALYKKDAWKKQRDKIGTFREKVVDFIRTSLIPQYESPLDELEHCKNIDHLIQQANQADKETRILGTNGYRYGVAQKLLNLALKYYWCLGQISEPPHCPIDKIVIDHTPLRGRVNWTEITTREQYLSVISAVRFVAEQATCSISMWELNNYQRRKP
jgi:hypothetical protein